MNCRTVPPEENPRIEHFEHFASMQNPFVTITEQVDITDWFRRTKEQGKPFFLSFLYEVGAAANSVPELRRRIKDGKVVEFDVCLSSYTVILDDGTYRYCNVRTDLPFDEFLEKAQAKQKIAVCREHLTEDDDPDSCFFISCLPWMSYSSAELPKPSNMFSITSITWGKYYTENRLIEKDGMPAVEERVRIPVTIMVNHALADGVHIGRFFSALEDRLK